MGIELRVNGNHRLVSCVWNEVATPTAVPCGPLVLGYVRLVTSITSVASIRYPNVHGN